jgi:hypothetical protein
MRSRTPDTWRPAAASPLGSRVPSTDRRARCRAARTERRCAVTMPSTRVAAGRVLRRPCWPRAWR